MRYLIVDLETIPHPDAHKWVEPVKAPANYRDEAKKAAYIAEATAERDEKLGLDCDTNRIVALGVHVVGRSEPEVWLAKDEFEERHAILQPFWKLYREQRDTRIVTFNGTGFDLPVLVTRSINLDVDYPADFVFTPSWKSPHLDLYEWKKQMCGKAKSLAFYARQYGFTTLDKVHGSQISQLVNEDRWQEIHDHCLSDVGLTHALANRWKRLPVTAAVAA